MVAVVRAALVLTVGAGALVDDRPGLYHLAFVVMLVVAAAYAAAALVMTSRLQRWPSHAYAYAVLDVALLAALAHTSGGAVSEVRFAFFAVPVLAAMLFGPRVTAVASAAVVASYLTLALAHPPSDVAQDQQLAFVEVIYLGWAASPRSCCRWC